MNARLSVTPGLRLGVVTAVLAGMALTSLWSADPASARELQPGYKRVPAEIKIEQQTSTTEPDDDCAVVPFIVWPVLPNDDLSRWFYARYVWREQVREPVFNPEANPGPFDDEGLDVANGEFVFSGAPAGHHQNEIGISTSSAPGKNSRPDCGKLVARYQADFTDDPSQIWVDVPVFERAIVRGRVLGSDGKPLRGWKLRLIGRNAAASVNANAARTRLVTKTNRKGKYRFVVPGEVAAEAQDWRVAPRRARRFRPRKRTVEVEPGSKSKLRPFRKRR